MKRRKKEREKKNKKTTYSYKYDIYLLVYRKSKDVYTCYYEF